MQSALRQVNIDIPVLLISLQKFSFDQMLDLALDLCRLWLEQGALSENLVKQSVVLQAVPGLHYSDDSSIYDVLPLNRGLCQCRGLPSFLLLLDKADRNFDLLTGEIIIDLQLALAIQVFARAVMQEDFVPRDSQ